MEELNILKCRLVYLSYLYASKIMYGITCNLDEIECELSKVYDYIKTLQYPDCRICSPMEHSRTIYINRLAKNNNKYFCNTCK